MVIFVGHVRPFLKCSSNPGEHLWVLQFGLKGGSKVPSRKHLSRTNEIRLSGRIQFFPPRNTAAVPSPLLYWTL